MRISNDYCNKFSLEVGVHSFFLFIKVLQAITVKFKTSCFWNLQYVILVEELENKFLKWKQNLEPKGFKDDFAKTKVLVSRRTDRSLLLQENSSTV